MISASRESWKETMLEVRARKKLGEFLLDSELKDEGFICMTGPNGSGKSTFLNIVAGVLAPDEGFVKLSALDVTALPPEKREIVLVTPDSYIPHLAVDRHLEWGARVKNLKIEPMFVTKVKTALGISYNDKLMRLSLGMRERVALGTAIISKPRLILIDETFSNIDNRQSCISEFRKLCSETKIEAIFTTQFGEDSNFSDHGYLMNEGKLKKLFE